MVYIPRGQRGGLRAGGGGRRERRGVRGRDDGVDGLSDDGGGIPADERRGQRGRVRSEAVGGRQRAAVLDLRGRERKRPATGAQAGWERERGDGGVHGVDELSDDVGSGEAEPGGTVLRRGGWVRDEAERERKRAGLFDAVGIGHGDGRGVRAGARRAGAGDRGGNDGVDGLSDDGGGVLPDEQRVLGWVRHEVERDRDGVRVLHVPARVGVRRAAGWTAAGRRM